MLNNHNNDNNNQNDNDDKLLLRFYCVSIVQLTRCTSMALNFNKVSESPLFSDQLTAGPAVWMFKSCLNVNLFLLFLSIVRRYSALPLLCAGRIALVWL